MGMEDCDFCGRQTACRLDAYNTLLPICSSDVKKEYRNFFSLKSDQYPLKPVEYIIMTKTVRIMLAYFSAAERPRKVKVHRVAATTGPRVIGI